MCDSCCSAVATACRIMQGIGKGLRSILHHHEKTQLMDVELIADWGLLFRTISRSAGCIALLRLPEYSCEANKLVSLARDMDKYTKAKKPSILAYAFLTQ